MQRFGTIRPEYPKIREKYFSPKNEFLPGRIPAPNVQNHSEKRVYKRTIWVHVSKNKEMEIRI